MDEGEGTSEKEKLNEKHKELERKIEEVTREAQVFTTKMVLEGRVKMFNDFKESNVTYWDLEA